MTTTVPPPRLPRSSVGEGLPPAASRELEPIYGAALADLGLRLTDRGGLIDRSGGGYEPSAAGTHLALYVEPVGARTNAEYVEGIGAVAAVFGDVFDRWPGLTSYDVCQEPADDGEGDVDEPLPVTQIELTAEEAEVFDWAAARSADLVRASLASPPACDGAGERRPRWRSRLRRRSSRRPAAPEAYPRSGS